MLNKCKKGEHHLEAIFESSEILGASDVVRWCNICGSVVVDVDVDGRTKPGERMKMKTPAIAKVNAKSKKGNP